MRALVLLLFAMVLSSPRAHGGYTHYFTWLKTPDEARLRPCIAEMNLLIEARTNVLAYPDDPRLAPHPVRLEALSVEFNGIGDNAHEPFLFPGTNGFNFCKTQWKPYDEVVTACLLVARDHFPTSVLSISSDGEWDDWEKGARLYASIFHRRAKNPMGDSGVDWDPQNAVVVIFVAGVLIATVVSYLKSNRWTRE